MEEACNKCKYLHPNLKGAKYFKCYCGDCPAKKIKEAENTQKLNRKEKDKTTKEV